MTHGITFISRFQLWTQPIWIVLHVCPFVVIALERRASPIGLDAFLRRARRRAGSFDLLLFGAAASVVFCADRADRRAGRLPALPAAATGERRIARGGWPCWRAGPGWIVIGTLKLLAGSFLATLALSTA